MTSFTPGPWRVGKKYEADIYAAQASRVAAVVGIANAAHIVRCVNAHDDLLAALQLIHARLTECAKHPISASEAYDSFYQAEVIAAIAKATS